MDGMGEVIKKLQEKIYEAHGIRTDAYYQEGKGVIFVPEGFELVIRNVVASFSELELKVMKFIS